MSNITSGASSLAAYKTIWFHPPFFSFFLFFFFTAPHHLTRCLQDHLVSPPLFVFFSFFLFFFFTAPHHLTRCLQDHLVSPPFFLFLRRRTTSSDAYKTIWFHPLFFFLRRRTTSFDAYKTIWFHPPFFSFFLFSYSGHHPSRRCHLSLINLPQKL
jgi:hypothetical protein